MHWDGYGWGWGMGFGWLFMLLFWIIIIAGGVLLVRWLVFQGERRGQGPSDTPLDVLKKRYARGEISKEEYEQIKKDIS